jgi:hypothetical protein
MAALNQLTIGYAAGRIAFGLGLLAVPARIGSSWVGSAAERPPVHVMIRGLGARDIALATGALVAAAAGGAVRPWLIGCVACDIADTAATLAAGDTVPDRGRWGTVALAGGSAIAGTALAVAAEA